MNIEQKLTISYSYILTILSIVNRAGQYSKSEVTATQNHDLRLGFHTPQHQIHCYGYQICNVTSLKFISRVTISSYSNTFYFSL